MNLYVCESCGYTVCVEKVPKKCPNCRARLFEKGECPKGMKEVHCPECEESFQYDPEKGTPFKCAFCDHTFAEADYF
jgi:hypothetical protein